MKESESSDFSLSPSTSSSPTSMVKSCTIVKYGGPQSGPSKFLQLGHNTNLKNPPDNWLCGRFGDHIWSYPLRRNNSSILSSFRMANHFPDCIGEVDVIADAEDIKRLLKMPFDDSNHISMMVHRVGKSLLIDDFDITSHLLRSEEKQWDWLRKFFTENIIGQYNRDNTSCLTKKPITRYDLQCKNILCKFLHYSIDDKSDNTQLINNDDHNDHNDHDHQKNMIISPKISSKTDENTHTSDGHLFIDDHNLSCLIPEMVDHQLNTIEHKSGCQYTGHLRNVLWTFEDIRMLVSSNMPIFGDVHHPAVSLRLRDMSRPINVLTGLDYWLDNLMCSVPEVVMCYHLDGIVQKYELIKTEEIPQMKNSQFPPKVIRNIAQNILAFLKSKATKSGHTYWLFKGKNDDVVKLYDLTTLCADYMDEDDSNPFTVPVAMLLYRVAKNMRDLNKHHSSTVNNKVHKLLINCLALLDPKKHQQIVSSANYLLSDVYVPNDIDPTMLPLKDQSDDDEPEDVYDDDGDDGDRCDSPLSNGSSNDDCAILNVKKLEIPNYIDSNAAKEENESKKTIKDDDDVNMDWPNKCRKSLHHVIEGLKVLQHAEYDCFKVSKSEEMQKMANPSEAIPLHFSDDNDQLRHGKEMTPSVNSELKSLMWKMCISVCLLQKAAQVFCLLSELSNSVKNGLLAFRYARMGILCYECAQRLIEKSGHHDSLKEPLSCLLALCGDIHVTMTMQSQSDNSEENNCDKIINESDLIELLEQVCDTEIIEEYRWAYNSAINYDNDIEDRLKISARCYDEALNQLLQSKSSFDSNSKALANLRERLRRRSGNILNELGCYYMNIAVNKYNDLDMSQCDDNHNDVVSDLETIIKKSHTHLERSLEMFTQINDNVNMALVLSNCGRLMRTYAHIHAPHARNTKTESAEFSSKEKHFYLKAINYYQTAFKELGPNGDTQYTSIWDNINWELCTTYFTIGYLMQDFAPLSTTAYETLEKEISDYLKKALSLCQNAQKSESHRLILYQYRAATINHRIASLYHNSYRNSSDSMGKQLFNIADDYYCKSQSLFNHLNKLEYLRVSLERVGLHEHFLTSLDGFSSKIKALNVVLRILLSASDNDFKAENDDDKLEIEKLLNILEARINFCVKGIVKCYSKRASKNKDILNKWKHLESAISVQNDDYKQISVYNRIKNIFNQIESSHLIVPIDGGDN